jgi:hypothetical protein
VRGTNHLEKKVLLGKFRLIGKDNIEMYITRKESQNV